ncbi:MAG: hypothetical protein PHF44_02085 [Candidatus Pacebacteria bacterium]|nr:hypothetical protein [Candidatus Paceibacterota bacterium]
MEKILSVRRIGLVARIADMLMVPIMYISSGTFREKPQHTHAWNVQNLPADGDKRLVNQAMAHCKGIAEQIARRHWLDFQFHILIIGGWRNYVVLQPEYEEVWHVGWRASDAGAQISILPLVGPVRMLIGSEDVSFFGVTDDGVQIPIREIGKGRIGDCGEFSKIQLY